MPCRIGRLKFSRDEVAAVEGLLSEIMGAEGEVEMESALQIAPIVAQELPRRVRQKLYDFKIERSTQAVIINGCDFDQKLIGSTPSQHLTPAQVEHINRYELLHIMFALLLGEPFAWTTIQNGYVINDVFPVLEHRKLIASSGADLMFDLHTEDAFHFCAGDFLGLMCLRNPGRVNTVLSTVSREDLPEGTISVLFEPRFIIGANVAQKVDEIKSPSPIFFGNMQFPYFRINLNQMRPISGDKKAEMAMNLLKKILVKNSVKICLRSGDFAYIDNYRVAHGRESYIPKYDGTDRWLKRLYITSSFRNSAAFRTEPFNRVLTP